MPSAAVCTLRSPCLCLSWPAALCERRRAGRSCSRYGLYALRREAHQRRTRSSPEHAPHPRARLSTARRPARTHLWRPSPAMQRRHILAHRAVPPLNVPPHGRPWLMCGGRSSVPRRICSWRRAGGSVRGVFRATWRTAIATKMLQNVADKHSIVYMRYILCMSCIGRPVSRNNRSTVVRRITPEATSQGERTPSIHFIGLWTTKCCKRMVSFVVLR